MQKSASISSTGGNRNSWTPSMNRSSIQSYHNHGLGLSASPSQVSQDSLQINLVTLSFNDAEVEKEYETEQYRLTKTRFRVYIFTMVIIVFAHALARFLMFDEDKNDAGLLILYGVGFTVPACFILTLELLGLLKRHFQLACFTMSLLSSYMGTVVEGIVYSKPSPLRFVQLIATYAIFITWIRMRTVWLAVTSVSSTLCLAILTWQYGTYDDSGIDGLVVVPICFIVDAFFIKAAYDMEKNAKLSFLRERSLLKAYQKARNQLTALNKTYENGMDLDSPLLKAIGSIKHVLSSPEFPAVLIDELAGALGILESNDLSGLAMARQMGSGTLDIDGETKDWLFSELVRRKETKENVLVRKRSRRKSVVSLRTHGSSIAEEPDQPTPTPAGLLNVPLRTEGYKSSTDDDDRTLMRETTELAAYLDTYLGRWDCDVFEVDRLSAGRGLYFVTARLFRSFNLMETYNIDEGRLHYFLMAAMAGYQDNPYHNAIHASDVVQTLAVLICMDKIQSYISDLEIFAILVAAVIHDYQHPGLNNNFQIAVRSETALLYNDKAVLENMHASTGFRLFLKDETNILDGLSLDQFREFRSLFIDFVLATDIGQHFSILNSFKARTIAEDFDADTKDDRVLVLKMAIKCADISNGAKPYAIYVQWVDRVMEEFYRQGDEEAKRDLPISPFMDRKAPPPARERCQLGFLKFICSPLYDSFVGDYLGAREILDVCESNRQEMERRAAAVEKAG